MPCTADRNRADVDLLTFALHTTSTSLLARGGCELFLYLYTSRALCNSEHYHWGLSFRWQSCSQVSCVTGQATLDRPSSVEATTAPHSAHLCCFSGPELL